MKYCPFMNKACLEGACAIWKPENRLRSYGECAIMSSSDRLDIIENDINSIKVNLRSTSQ